MSSVGHSSWCGYPSEPCSSMCKANIANKHYSRGYESGRGSDSTSNIKSLRGKVGYWKKRCRTLEAENKKLKE